MNLQELMNEYLTEMAQANERPLFPIFGAIKTDGMIHNVFLSVSKNRLLVTMVYRKSFGNTYEVPLELKCVSIRKRRWSKQQIITIGVHHHPPVQIYAFPTIRRLENQEENLRSFMDLLTQNGPAPIPLKEREGVKLRHQYINVYLAICAIGFGIFLPVIFISEWVQYGMSFAIFCAYLYDTLPILDLFFTPLIVFSLLNRFFFGKIVCVLNETGFYMETDFYQWSEIQSIFLMQNLPGRRDPTHNTAILTIQNGDEPYEVHLPYFPFFGRHTIKKFAPQVPILHDKKCIILNIAVSVALFVFALSLFLFN